MEYKYQIYTVILLILISFICIDTVSARYPTSLGPNNGISDTDTVFRGEQFLDFSALNKGALLPDSFEQTGPGQTGVFSTPGGTGTVPSGVPTGRYYPHYSDGTTSTTKWILVQDLSIGPIGIYTYNTDIVPASLPQQPSAIAKTTDIAFVIRSADIDGANLTGNWYKYTLARDTVTTSNIINTNGNSVDLSSLTADPRTQPVPGPTAPIFSLIDQSIVSSQTGDVPMTVTFTTQNLNGLVVTSVYPFTASLFSPALALSSTEVAQGKYVDLTITGVPYTSYNISITGSGITPTGSATAPRFESGAWDTKINEQMISIHTEWQGTKTVQIYVPDGAIENVYTVTLTDASGIKVTKQFSVDSGTISVTFDEPISDIKSGTYAIGDIIHLSGNVPGATKPVPVYLYVTGPNLPQNGAMLDSPRTQVVDGNPATFTVTQYSVIMGEWSYSWDTAGLADGTYTVHVNLNPYGYLSSRFPGDPGTDAKGNVPPSHDFPLSEPSLGVSMANSGIFSKGDILYGRWLSRGSAEEIRWYIFGTNFKYADRMDHLSAGMTTGGEPYESDKGTPYNEYGFTYGRPFTQALSPGQYYMVCTSPGPNKVFETTASAFKTTHFTINSTSGVNANINELQGSDAANALIEMIKSPNSDDLYVRAQILIEEPWIRINLPDQIPVGEELKILGSTNLAASDTAPDGSKTTDALSLSIYRMDMDLGSTKSNTAMIIPVDETIPSKSNKYAGYNAFKYDEIDTSTWYPGSYLVTITSKDTGYKQSSSFELTADRSSSYEYNSKSQTDPSLSEKARQTVTNTPVITPTPTPQASYYSGNEKYDTGNKQQSGVTTAIPVLITLIFVLVLIVAVAKFRRV